MMKKFDSKQYYRLAAVVVILSELVATQTNWDTVTPTTLDRIDSSSNYFTAWPTDLDREKDFHDNTVRNNDITDINPDQRNITASSEINYTSQPTSFTSPFVSSSLSSSVSASSPTFQTGKVNIIATSTTTKTASPTTVKTNPSIEVDNSTTQEVKSVFNIDKDSSATSEGINVYTSTPPEGKTVINIGIDASTTVKTVDKPTTPGVNGVHKPTKTDVNSVYKPTTSGMNDVNKSIPSTKPDVDSVQKPFIDPDMPEVKSSSTAPKDNLHKLTPTTITKMHNLSQSTNIPPKTDIVHTNLLTTEMGVTTKTEMRLETVNRTGETQMQTVTQTDTPTTAEGLNRTDNPIMPEVNLTDEQITQNANRTEKPMIPEVSRITKTTTSEVSRTRKTTMPEVSRTSKTITQELSRTSKTTTPEVSRTSKPATQEVSRIVTTTNPRDTVNIESTSTITLTSSNINVDLTNVEVSTEAQNSTDNTLPVTKGAHVNDSLTTERTTEEHKTTVHRVSNTDQIALNGTSLTTVSVTGSVSNLTVNTADIETTKSMETTTQNKALNTSQNTDQASTETLSISDSGVQIRHQTGDADDDTYWPIAIAVTVGVPVIIVFAVTITVLNRKRLERPNRLATPAFFSKLEKAHNAALSGYITPPTEYDA
ncbi:serine-rich adhesin for platelets-like isoform X4 [Pecten maximus]|uniref:serine-rich adhesin for platelets-like isoform X4 n=1 Tax=Pecten maximus TaxID=6579 RepID=UPI00145900D0|nr:serine-rich adhesin for platelets-like isoform X4 [Pecten maximus]